MRREFPSGQLPVLSALLALALPVLLWSGLLTLPLLLPSRFFISFHLVAEIFAVLVAALVFSTGYHNIDERRNPVSTILACAFLGVGLLDFLHLLSYVGMPDFISPNTVHKGIIFWLAARFLAAAALLTHVLLISIPVVQEGGRRLRSRLLGVTLAYLAAFAYVGLWRPDWFPATFVPGVGLTHFKILIEWLVIALHVATLVFIAGRRVLAAFPALRLLVPALLLMIGSELFFSLYHNTTDNFNVLGHLYKVLAYLLIYRCLFLESIELPLLRLASERERRAKAEEALTRSHASLLGAQRIAHLGNWDWDIIDNTLVWSDEIFRIFGVKPQEFAASYEAFLSFVHADDRAAVQEAVDAALSGDRPYSIEHRIVLADGSEKWVYEQAEVQRDAAGRPLRMVGTVHDLTERKRMELALKERKAYLKTLVRTIPDLVWLKDPEGVYLACNPRFERFYGASEDEIIGKTDYDFVGRELADFFRKNDRKAMEVGGPSVNEEWLTFSEDGYHGLFETIKTPMWDETGRLIGVLGIARDITERKRMEEELAARVREYRTLVLNSPDMIARYNRDLELVYANQPYERVNGLALAEETGKTPGGENGGMTKGYAAALSRVLQTGQSAELDLFRLDAEGKVVLYNVRAVAEFDENGMISGVLTVARDVTERQSLEDQLLQARKIESIGVLAGGIAHDFNNILTPIMMRTEMAMQLTPVDGDLYHNLAQVHQSAERARDLVRQILDFSRQGKQAPIPLKLGTVVKEGVKLLRSSISSVIGLKCRIESEDDTVLADPTQMLQVLMNLTVNAAQAMEESGGAIRVTLTDADPAGLPAECLKHPDPGCDYLNISVQDTGKGIAPEHLGRIFEPYFTTKGKGQGTGLGLAVCHGIVESHGGVITVRSESGKGTTFEVFLPKSRSMIVDEPGDSGLVLPGGDERILLVDDDPAIVAASVSVLEQLGYRVTGLTGSIEALAVFAAAPDDFDLLITDHAMSQMTGVTLALEVMKIRPELPVILCTGFSEKMDEEKAGEMGISAFVMKPFSLSRFTETIRRVLDKMS